MSFNESAQGSSSQNEGNSPYHRLFCVVSKQIHDKKDLKLRQRNESTSMIKTEHDAQTVGKLLKTPLQSVSSAFQPFNELEYQGLFAQQDCQQWKPPNIGNKKSFNFQTQIQFKRLKKKSYFRHIIPINTIVLARYEDLTAWPAVVINVRVLEPISQYRKVLYDVEFINKNHIKRQLGKYSLVRFYSETVGMLRESAKNNKQLLKALKIAQKLYLEDKGEQKDILNSNSELKLSPKIVQNIILKGQQHVKVTKLQEDYTNNRVQKNDKKLTEIQHFILEHPNTSQKVSKKWKPLNLLIQTPKVPLHYLSQSKRNQPNSQSQMENSDSQSVNECPSDGKFYQYDDCDETYYSEYDQNGIQIDRKTSAKNSLKEEQFDKVICYLQNLKPRVEREVKKPKQFQKFNRVFDLIDRSFQDFNESDVLKYSKVIKLSMQISLKKLPQSQQKNRALMQQLRQKLCHLYLTLKEYKGTHAFVTKLSQTLIEQLETIYATSSKEIQF